MIDKVISKKEKNMARYDEDEDFNEDLFPDIDDDENEEQVELNAEYIKVLEKRELIEALKLQIIQKEINYKVLAKAIRYSEKNWFWRLKSAQSKLNSIVEAYQTFKALVDIDIQYDDEEKEE